MFLPATCLADGLGPLCRACGCYLFALVLATVGLLLSGAAAYAVCVPSIINYDLTLTSSFVCTSDEDTLEWSSGTIAATTELIDEIKRNNALEDEEDIFAIDLGDSGDTLTWSGGVLGNDVSITGGNGTDNLVITTTSDVTLTLDGDLWFDFEVLEVSGEGTLVIDNTLDLDSSGQAEFRGGTITFNAGSILKTDNIDLYEGASLEGSGSNPGKVELYRYGEFNWYGGTFDIVIDGESTTDEDEWNIVIAEDTSITLDADLMSRVKNFETLVKSGAGTLVQETALVLTGNSSRVNVNSGTYTIDESIVLDVHRVYLNGGMLDYLGELDTTQDTDTRGKVVLKDGGTFTWGGGDFTTQIDGTASPSSGTDRDEIIVLSTTSEHFVLDEERMDLLFGFEVLVVEGSGQVTQEHDLDLCSPNENVSCQLGRITMSSGTWTIADGVTLAAHNIEISEADILSDAEDGSSAKIILYEIPAAGSDAAIGSRFSWGGSILEATVDASDGTVADTLVLSPSRTDTLMLTNELLTKFISFEILEKDDDGLLIQSEDINLGTITTIEINDGNYLLAPGVTLDSDISLDGGNLYAGGAGTLRSKVMLTGTAEFTWSSGAFYVEVEAGSGTTDKFILSPDRGTLNFDADIISGFEELTKEGAGAVVQTGSLNLGSSGTFTMTGGDYELADEAELTVTTITLSGTSTLFLRGKLLTTTKIEVTATSDTGEQILIIGASDALPSTLTTVNLGGGDDSLLWTTLAGFNGRQGLPATGVDGGDGDADTLGLYLEEDVEITATNTLDLSSFATGFEHFEKGGQATLVQATDINLASRSLYLSGGTWQVNSATTLTTATIEMTGSATFILLGSLAGATKITGAAGSQVVILGSDLPNTITELNLAAGNDSLLWTTLAGYNARSGLPASGLNGGTGSDRLGLYLLEGTTTEITSTNNINIGTIIADLEGFEHFEKSGEGTLVQSVDIDFGSQAIYLTGGTWEVASGAEIKTTGDFLLLNETTLILEGALTDVDTINGDDNNQTLLIKSGASIDESVNIVNLAGGSDRILWTTVADLEEVLGLADRTVIGYGGNNSFGLYVAAGELITFDEEPDLSAANNFSGFDFFEKAGSGKIVQNSELNLGFSHSFLLREGEYEVTVGNRLITNRVIMEGGTMNGLGSVELSGNGRFDWYGGTIDLSIDGASGTDTLQFSPAADTTITLDDDQLALFTSFEVFTKTGDGTVTQSDDVDLGTTGSFTIGDGEWQIDAQSQLTLRDIVINGGTLTGAVSGDDQAVVNLTGNGSLTWRGGELNIRIEAGEDDTDTLALVPAINVILELDSDVISNLVDFDEVTKSGDGDIYLTSDLILADDSEFTMESGFWTIHTTDSTAPTVLGVNEFTMDGGILTSTYDGDDTIYELQMQGESEFTWTEGRIDVNVQGSTDITHDDELNLNPNTLTILVFDGAQFNDFEELNIGVRNGPEDAEVEQSGILALSDSGIITVRSADYTLTENAEIEANTFFLYGGKMATSGALTTDPMTNVTTDTRGKISLTGTNTFTWSGGELDNVRVLAASGEEDIIKLEPNLDSAGEIVVLEWDAGLTEGFEEIEKSGAGTVKQSGSIDLGDDGEATISAGVYELLTDATLTVKEGISMTGDSYFIAAGAVAAAITGSNDEGQTVELQPGGEFMENVNLAGDDDGDRLVLHVSDDMALIASVTERFINIENMHVRFDDETNSDLELTWGATGGLSIGDDEQFQHLQMNAGGTLKLENNSDLSLNKGGVLSLKVDDTEPVDEDQDEEEEEEEEEPARITTYTYDIDAGLTLNNDAQIHLNNLNGEPIMLTLAVTGDIVLADNSELASDVMPLTFVVLGNSGSSQRITVTLSTTDSDGFDVSGSEVLARITNMMVTNNADVFGRLENLPTSIADNATDATFTVVLPRFFPGLGHIDPSQKALNFAFDRSESLPEDAPVRTYLEEVHRLIVDSPSPASASADYLASLHPDSWAALGAAISRYQAIALGRVLDRLHGINMSSRDEEQKDNYWSDDLRPWVLTSFKAGNFDPGGHSQGYELQVNAALAGVDRRFGNTLSGVFIGATDHDHELTSDITDYASKSSYSSAVIGAFTQFKFAGLQFSALFSHATGSGDTRVISPITERNNQRAVGDFDMELTTIQGRLSWGSGDFTVAGLLMKPILDLTWAKASRDGFQELITLNGTAAKMHVEEHEDDSLTLNLGAHFGREHQGQRVDISLGWRQEIDGGDPFSRNNFTEVLQEQPFRAKGHTPWQRAFYLNILAGRIVPMWDSSMYMEAALEIENDFDSFESFGLGIRVGTSF